MKNNLSKQYLKDMDPMQVDIPHPSVFELPERVIQFGTGALLRGLPDDYIHRANQAGIFNGRILVVKSTTHGDTAAFDQQDGLYTLVVQGFENGEIIAHHTINAAISRVLSAHHHWDTILQTATSPEMSILISNTTEAGIVETSGSISDQPPASFAAKVTAYLYRRFCHFDGDVTKGLIIIPTELISDNATILKRIVLQLTDQQQLGDSFIAWIDQANYFCNSLVDRIVPGRIDPTVLPYTDQLAIMAEPYRLWAIETDSEVVRDRLSFSCIDSSIKIVPNIEQYKEIKLRMLNATHTLCCGVALLSQVEDVKAFFDDPRLQRYIHHILFNEISPMIQQSGIAQQETEAFGHAVIDRFKNPFLSHRWQSVALQYTAKMQMRVEPLIQKWYGVHKEPPVGIALGIAAYCIHAKSGSISAFQDDHHSAIRTHLEQENPIVFLFSDPVIWGEYCTAFLGLSDLVQEIVAYAEQQSIVKAIAYFIPHN